MPSFSVWYYMLGCTTVKGWYIGKIQSKPSDYLRGYQGAIDKEACAVALHVRHIVWHHTRFERGTDIAAQPNWSAMQKPSVWTWYSKRMTQEVCKKHKPDSVEEAQCHEIWEELIMELKETPARLGCGQVQLNRLFRQASWLPIYCLVYCKHWQSPVPLLQEAATALAPCCSNRVKWGVQTRASKIQIPSDRQHAQEEPAHSNYLPCQSKTSQA